MIWTVQERGIILVPKYQEKKWAVLLVGKQENCITCAVTAAGCFVLPVFIDPRQKMGTVPEIEDDDLETATDKCFACDDFGKEGELWYRCTGCVNLGAQGVQRLGLPRWLLM